MTRQEAIGKIDYIIDNGQDYGYWTDAQKKALYMAIDALEQEPKHGKWINGELYPNNIYGNYHAECTNCGEVRIIDNFCPNCGARMMKNEVDR